jgi:hypothetical protein
VALLRVAIMCFACVIVISTFTPLSAAVDVNTLVSHWLQASRGDVDAALGYGYTERIRKDDGTKTYQVTLLEGSPFKQLISVDDRPLDVETAEREQRRFEETKQKRTSESPTDRAARIADYKKDYDRGHRILEQMPRAFDYTLQRTERTGAFNAYVLRAVPKPGYDPPSTEAEVLTGMQGMFWIDSKSSQLIRGLVRLRKAVRIDEFASVQPGTEFELEQTRVGPDLWLPAHFQIRSHSRIMFVFHHHIDEDRTFFNYRRELSSANAERRAP